MTLLLALSVALAEPAVDAVDADAPEAVEATGPDRSGPPDVVPPVPFALPDAEVHELSDGVRALYVHVPGVRKVGVEVVLHRGSLDVADRPTPAAHLTGWIQDASTERWGLEEFAAYKDMYDISVSTWMRYTSLTARLKVPAEDLDFGLEALEEVLLRPEYHKLALRHAHQSFENELYTDGPSSPRTLRSNALTYAWYPADNPYGARPDVDGWDAVRTADLHALHQRILDEAPVTVLVVGDVAWSDVEAPLRELTADLGAPGEEHAQPAFTPPTSTRVVCVDVPGVEQVQIGLRLAAPLDGDPDRATFQVVDKVVGGTFLSRLNTVLREEKGYTYGAYSGYLGGLARGHWTLRFDTRTDSTAAAITDVEAVLARLVEGGLTDEEIGWGRTAFVTDWNTDLQTGSYALSAYSDMMDFGRTASEERAHLMSMDAITVDDTREVAARWFGADAPRLWVLVGDRSVLEGQLAELGWEAEWYAPQAVMLGEL